MTVSLLVPRPSMITAVELMQLAGAREIMAPSPIGTARVVVGGAGGGEIRQRLLEASAGDLVMVVDHLAPPADVLEALLVRLAENPGLALATAAWPGCPVGALSLVELLADPTLAHGAVLRRSAVESVGGFRPSLRRCWDEDLAIRVVASGAAAERVGEASRILGDECFSAMTEVHGDLYQRHAVAIAAEIGQELMARDAESRRASSRLADLSGAVFEPAPRSAGDHEARQELERTRAAWAGAAARVEALERSASWRITAPLRRLLATFSSGGS